jgi:hypothetical protein
LAAIRESFPAATLTQERLATSSGLTELLVRSRFDIVQLTVDVRKDGGIAFDPLGRGDVISPEGLVDLLQVSHTKLLVLASCNSVPLAIRLSHRIAMIAATEYLDVEGYDRWARVFYKLLSQGSRISEAFRVALTSSTYYSRFGEVKRLPIELGLDPRQDVTFR